MTMDAITVAEVRALALKNYNKGGDGIYECWEDKDIQREIDEGAKTVDVWLGMFKFDDETNKELKAACGCEW